MAEKIELTDEMKSQIGKESPPWDFEVTTTSVRMFARGVGYTDPVYYDVEAARKAGYPNLPAPPTYLGSAVFLPGRSSDTFSGPTEGIPSVNHGLKGLLDGGTETEYLEPICAGDTLVAVQKLEDMKVANSTALGGKMLVVTVGTTYTNKASGKLAARQTSQVIYY
ncbi:MAG TPA: MaoC family dehydratase N-terminal domain-containing protein [Candidatus Limnocylindrales bacterium]|nr:MaoC family dehydratase N-terminal domain-containing protein [Candidatus Limnocylindrales bacterium]